nr:WAS/WASL-interacting protein family member 3-like isoform X1 [Camelus dromedarius]
MTASGPRDPSPLPPPPRRPRPRLPAPEQESAAGRPDPPKGPEAGGTRVPGPWGRTPSRKLPQVQSIDTAPRGEGAPSFSRAQRPGSSGRRPSLASDPAPGRGAARAPALRREAAGAGKRGRWAGESGGASCRGPGEEPRWREPDNECVWKRKWTWMWRGAHTVPFQAPRLPSPRSKRQTELYQDLRIPLHLPCPAGVGHPGPHRFAPPPSWTLGNIFFLIKKWPEEEDGRYVFTAFHFPPCLFVNTLFQAGK